MSASITINTSREKTIPITISDINVNVISSSEGNVSVAGEGNFQMIFATSSGWKSSLPDFSKKINGTLELSPDTPTVELRKIPIEEAEPIVREYIKKHPGCRTSDLILELGLDPDIVITILSKLQKEGHVEGRDIERGS